jgi:hypothetical protein
VSHFVSHNAFVSHPCRASHCAPELGNSTETRLSRSYCSYTFAIEGGKFQFKWVFVSLSISIDQDTPVNDFTRLSLRRKYLSLERVYNKEVSIHFSFKKIGLGHFGYDKIYSKVSNPPKSHIHALNVAPGIPQASESIVSRRL